MQQAQQVRELQQFLEECQVEARQRPHCVYLCGMSGVRHLCRRWSYDVNIYSFLFGHLIPVLSCSPMK